MEKKCYLCTKIQQITFFHQKTFFMARVSYIEPYADISGKIANTSHISHRTTFGVRHTYAWNPNTVIQPTPGRLIHREAMAQASVAASLELSSPESAKQWHTEYHESGYTGPINSFVIKQMLPEIKSRLQEEWKDRPIEELLAYVEEQKNARTNKH